MSLKAVAVSDIMRVVMSMDKILLVEDDRTIALGLEYSLGQDGFAVTVCHNVNSALSALEIQDLTSLFWIWACLTAAVMMSAGQ